MFLWGNVLQKKREKMNLTQLQLSEMVNVSGTYMSHIERAKSKPSLQVIADIATALHTSIDYLVLGIPDRESAPKMNQIYQDISNLLPDQRNYLETLKSKNELKKPTLTQFPEMAFLQT